MYNPMAERHPTAQQLVAQDRETKEINNFFAFALRNAIFQWKMMQEFYERRASMFKYR